MASSAAQNIPGSAHIQALSHKTHHKPATEKPATDETFADMLAENEAPQPQKPAQPRDKAAHAAHPAKAGAQTEAAPQASEETTKVDVADAETTEVVGDADVPAEEEHLADNDNDVPDGILPQAALPEQAKLKQAAAPAPDADEIPKTDEAIKPAAPTPANDIGQPADTDEDTTATAEAVPDFEKALQDARPEAPRAPDAATPRPVEMKPAADIANVTLAGNTAPQHAAPGAEKITPPAQAESPLPHQPTPDVNQFAVEVAAKSQAGAKQFDIRLDPPELGRVEVRLSIDAAGKAEAHLTAETSQTLDLLQKDAPVLARALREAGLNLSQDGLNFSLKNQQQQAGDDSRHGGHPATRAAMVGSQSPDNKPAEGSAYLRRSLGLLDIRV